MIHDDKRGLPTGWRHLLLSEACEVVQDGSHFSPSNLFDEPGPGKYPYITSKNVRPWGLDLCDVQYVDEEYHRSVWARCKPMLGDVLLVKDGVKTGTVALNTLDEPFSLLSSVALLRPKSFLSAKYLRYYLESPQASNLILGGMSGTAIKRIILDRLRRTIVPLPSPDEQERIVTRIEELMSDVDAGVKDAESAARLVGRCRQAARNHLTLGGVSRGLDVEGKPVLPDGWQWSTIGGIAERVQYGTSDKADLNVTEVPVLRMGNIKDGVLITRELKYMPDGWGCVDDFRLEEGDILFTRTNGNPALVGKSAVYRGVPGNAVFASYLIRVRLDGSKAVPEFVIHCLNSAFGRGYIASVVSQVGQANVNGSKLKRFPIPLPPLDEQERLAGMADDLLLALDVVQEDVVSSLRRAESLRQSILKSAFSGQLT